MDALVVGTGWPEFRGLDFDRIKHLLKNPVIVDTKNLLDSVRLRAMGFERRHRPQLRFFDSGIFRVPVSSRTALPAHFRRFPFQLL